MKMKIAVLFPGQGSQFVGMGKEFLETSAEAREIMAVADEVTGVSLSDLCVNGPMEDLTAAKNVQPAITAINLICWQQLQKALAGKEVLCFAGHSLGEYSALQAAGVLSVADTIKLVTARGALMGAEGDKHPGGMRAIIGLEIEQVEEAVAAAQGAGVVAVANYNTAQQIVISGDEAGLAAAGEKAAAAGGKVVPLSVSVANHSPLVAGAVPEFTKIIDSVAFSAPKSSVVLNVSAAVETEVSSIKEKMARQIISQVRWYETILLMLNKGVDIFVEVGPKTVLKGMMRKIVPRDVRCTTLQFDTPEGLEKCMKVLG